MNPVTVLLRFALDAVIFVSLAAIFLFVYIHRYAAPVEAVLPHLRLVAALILGIAVIRLALCRVFRGRVVRNLAAATVITAALAAMVLYYSLVIIGLEFWGRVITWDLILSYVRQIEPLADVLGLNLLLQLVALAVICAMLFAITWRYITHFDWAETSSHRMSAGLFASIVACGGAVSAAELYGFVADPATNASEPISLTLFPRASASDFEGNAIDWVLVARRDRMENAARAAYVPNTNAAHRNLILIVVDALRQDHMGIYGYERDTTPNLSRMAKEGNLRKVTGVHASCADSPCGLFSISASKLLRQFSLRPFSLQEALRRHGYSVHMILGGDHTSFYGLKEMYGEVDSYADGTHPLKRVAARHHNYVNDDQLVLDRLAELAAWDGRPVMMQIHLMSVHSLGKRYQSSARYQPAANYVLAENRDPAVPGHPGGRSRNYYDNGVVQADEYIERILQTLRSSGYLQNALVVITADHGEGLGEHGLFQHANGVYEEFLNVPFVMLSYGYRPDKPISNSGAASQVDIAPTILYEIGIPRPGTWVGAPLQETRNRDYVYFRERSKVGLIDSRDSGNIWKYWLDTRSNDEYAFNLSIDPHESANSIDAVSAERKREWRTRVVAEQGVNLTGRQMAADHSLK